MILPKYDSGSGLVEGKSVAALAKLLGLFLLIKDEEKEWKLPYPVTVCYIILILCRN